MFLYSVTYGRGTLVGMPNAYSTGVNHNQYYEQQIRIHLRPTSPVGRKRSRRSRDCSLCGLYSECRLLNLAVRADARDSPSAWS
jgi:hypothetical protein